MKKILFSLSSLLLVILFACNNDSGGDSLKTEADSLEKKVLEGHDVAMPKSMRIPNLQKEANRLIDSISKLPAKAQEAAAPYKAKLDNLLKDLDRAENDMDKWMEEFKLDSFKNDMAQRIKYLTDENLKIEGVKEKVLGSLAKADSLLKAKF